MEQELWQKEEKGLIGILPVRDDAEGSSIGTMINPGTGNMILIPDEFDSIGVSVLI